MFCYRYKMWWSQCAKYMQMHTIHWLWVWKHIQSILSLGGNMGGMAKVSKLWRKATKIPPGVSRLKAPGVMKLAWGNSMQMYSNLIHFRGLHNSLCSLTRWFQQPGFWITCYVCRQHVRNAIPTWDGESCLADFQLWRFLTSYITLECLAWDQTSNRYVRSALGEGLGRQDDARTSPKHKKWDRSAGVTSTTSWSTFKVQNNVWEC